MKKNTHKKNITHKKANVQKKSTKHKKKHEQKIEVNAYVFSTAMIQTHRIIHGNTISGHIVRATREDLQRLIKAMDDAKAPEIGFHITD